MATNKMADYLISPMCFGEIGLVCNAAGDLILELAKFVIGAANFVYMPTLSVSEGETERVRLTE